MDGGPEMSLLSRVRVWLFDAMSLPLASGPSS